MGNRIATALALASMTATLPSCTSSDQGVSKYSRKASDAEISRISERIAASREARTKRSAAMSETTLGRPLSARLRMTRPTDDTMPGPSGER